MSCLPRPDSGDDAHGRLRVLLGLSGLRGGGQAEDGRLLRVLFLWLRPLSTPAAVLASIMPKKPQKLRPDVAEIAFRTMLEATGHYRQSAILLCCRDEESQDGAPGAVKTYR